MFIAVVFPCPDSPVILIFSPFFILKLGIVIGTEFLLYLNLHFFSSISLKSFTTFNSFNLPIFSSSCFLAVLKVTNESII